MIERRKFDRVACYLIARAQSGEEDFFGTVRNISAGGAMIETDHPVEDGTIVELAFSSAADDSTLWEGRGRVVWSRQQEEKVYLGLQFVEPLEADWINI